MTKKVCLITGIGPGTGLATVKRFCDEYQVAMISRNVEFLDDVASKHANVYPFPCDVGDLHKLEDTVNQIRDHIGAPSVFIHNAVRGAFGSYEQIEVKSLERNFRINVSSLLQLTKLLAPAMIHQGSGAIITTGNTSAYRGSPNFTGFAPTKAAQRILCESLARTLGPKGIHVGYVAIDAVIDLAWTRRANAHREDDFYAQPSDIADQIWHLAHQPKSTWTFDLVIRPFGEKW